MSPSKVLLGFLTFLLLASGLKFVVEAINAVEDLTYNATEIEALHQFRKMVSPDLDKSYKNDDVYLIRWLRAQNLDVNRSREMLYRDMRWRGEESMDSIMNEDWGDFGKQYPIRYHGLDKDNKPIVSFFMEEVDIRSVVFDGNRNKVIRRYIQVFEWGERLVREERENGKNVTRFHVVANLRDFRPYQHLCIGCMQFYISMATALEFHYPNVVDSFITINTPIVFRAALAAMAPLLSQPNRELFQIYSSPEAWKPELEKFMPPTAIEELSVLHRNTSSPFSNAMDIVSSYNYSGNANAALDSVRMRFRDSNITATWESIRNWWTSQLSNVSQ